MADYSTVPDIKALFSQSKDKPELIPLCITKAGSIIDGALVKRYSLPLSAIHPLVKSISDDLTIYFIKRALNPGGGELDDESVDAYRFVIGQIEDIRKGKVDLVDAAGTRVATRETCSSSTEDHAPIFDLDPVEDHVIDEDYLDEIQDARD